MEFTLEPPRKTRVKPWAAVVRLTPAMLACLEGQGSGAASITLSATDNVRPKTTELFNPPNFFFWRIYRPAAVMSTHQAPR